MARTRLFAKLRRAALAVHRARREGKLEPKTVLKHYREAELERRAFLKELGSGLSVFALGLAPGCGDDDEPALPTTPTTSVRVAIVGGGIAGLHCAYRLLQAGVSSTVYEASSRTGGRMFTDRQSFGSQIAELGGEFIDTNHTTLHTLAQEFNIELDDREADLGPNTTDEVWWVEGRAVPDTTIVEQFTAVAPLMAEPIVQIEDEGNDALFEELDVTLMSDWLDENVPPATYPELHAVLTSAYRGEYGLETDEQSVLNLLYLIGSDEPDPFRIFGESDEKFHAHTGSQTFPEQLAQRLPGQIQTDRRLVRASGAGTGPYTLVFQDAAGTESSVEVDQVVFALPFTLLREVDLTNLELSEDKRGIIDTIGYGTNVKIIGATTRRVWRVDQDATGSVTADLPFQQCWDTAIGQDGEQGVLTNFLGGQRGVEVGTGEPEALFTDVISQLEAVFPGTEAAYVSGSAVRMHWPTHPFTKGSYTCYRPGQWSFFSLEGEREMNLHFCGEHTSLDFQGFMEGGAETGARAAGEILDDLGIAPSAIHQGLLDLRRGLPEPRSSRRGLGASIFARRRALSQRWSELRRARRLVG